MMKKIRYEHVNTYAEAELIMLTYDKAKLVTWEYSHEPIGFVVAIEGEEQ
jgi:hypothetical protein